MLERTARHGTDPAGGQTGAVEHTPASAPAEPARPPAPPGTAAVVLAAGAGTRFTPGADARHKLLAPIGGVPVVRRAVEAALAAGLDETVVVVGAVPLADVLPDGVTVVVAPRWAEGQAHSLQAAVAHARRRGHAAVVVGLGDQPGVPPSAWRTVAATPGELVVADFGGRRRPPVKIAASLFDELPRDGDEGARVLMRRRPDLVRAVACEGDPADVDTREDLGRWS